MPKERGETGRAALSVYARSMDREADLADGTADALAKAASRAEANGELDRAEAMWFTCRKIRVRGLLDRARAAAAVAQRES